VKESQQVGKHLQIILTVVSFCLVIMQKLWHLRSHWSRYSS